jgi:hypothetical protein
MFEVEFISFNSLIYGKFRTEFFYQLVRDFVQLFKVNATFLHIQFRLA